VRWLTSGAAPLIVSAFRRVRSSTSTDAFQTCDAGRAGVHLPSEALHRTSPGDVLPWIARERVPTCTVARELVPDMRRMCSAGRESASMSASPPPLAAERLVLLFLGLRASDLTLTRKQRPSAKPFLERFLDRSDNKYILVQFTVEKQLAKPFR
jgi:hypothetical protein